LVEGLGPDVVLMDIPMPGIDGLTTATRHIKRRWPDVRVIVLTLCDAYRSEALASGADVFLRKGSRAEELRDAILALAGRCVAPLRTGLKVMSVC
jgi:DNA-binding NarL/FixJ family response regulator